MLRSCFFVHLGHASGSCRLSQLFGGARLRPVAAASRSAACWMLVAAGQVEMLTLHAQFELLITHGADCCMHALSWL